MAELLTNAVGILIGMAGTAVVGYAAFWLWRRARSGKQIAGYIAAHFQPVRIDDVIVLERRFPYRVRADLQRAVDRLFGGETEIVRFCGVRQQFSHEGLDLSACLMPSLTNPAMPAPAQYEQIDIGDPQLVRVLKQGLWFLRRGTQKFVVLLSPEESFGRTSGFQVQIATVNNAEGSKISESLFRGFEQAVLASESYRGKVLSLEEEARPYSGASSGIKVHKLRTVEREQVILPRKTLDLLDRNVLEFVRQRPQLARFRQATRKGILFYGPPGTGKTHTIHYLAKALAGHTTLLITAEQVGLLGEYMTLARLLQPSIVVIEDVDLIARDRTQLGPCQEASLNKLLNEMDGLREEADILFILTTNRPETLEEALSARPGRVDQAVEFPLPDDEGREKLVRLYGQGIAISDELVRAIVVKTERVSAAFIKELMRRSVQFHLERNGTDALSLPDVDAALEEMLFSGGLLNLKLLGADGANRQAAG